MRLKERALAIVEALEAAYPDSICSLEALDALQLLIATRLSAQCTDERVNIVTPALFARFPDAEAFAAAEPEEIETYIRTCGLYKTKARDIREMCRMLLAEFGGRVPGTMEELLRLPGVGRKTANLVLGDIFGQPAVVVDTHCIRITNRLGLVHEDDPYKIELALKKLLPPDRSSAFCHRIVLHGRAVCRARGPQCEACTLAPYCDYAKALEKGAPAAGAAKAAKPAAKKAAR